MSRYHCESCDQPITDDQLIRLSDGCSHFIDFDGWRIRHVDGICRGPVVETKEEEK